MASTSDKKRILLILSLGLILRVVCACFYYGHPTDMSCFASWSDMMYRGGAGGFYTSDAFTDYPPLYMYILWFIGMIKNLVPMPDLIFCILLKMPAIIADILTALVLYRLSGKKQASVFWLINPAVILNSAVWGQVASVFTLAVFLALVLAYKKRLIPSYFVFAISVMIKPQALFYTPIFLFATAERTIYPEFNRKQLLRHIVWGIGAVLTALALCLPFGLGNVINQYIGTLSSYNYCSVNAYNLWSALGLNWEALKPCYSVFSTIAIVTAVILSGIFFFRMKSQGKYFFISGFICLWVFTFAVKMHERYAFPVMLFFLAAYLLTDDKKVLRCAVLTSIIQLVNCAYVLFFTGEQITAADEITAVFVGILTTALTVYVTYIAVQLCGFEKKADTTEKNYKITRCDLAVIAILTAVYSVITLTNLGDRKVPESGITLENSSASFSLSENNGISGFRLFLGEYHLYDGNTLTLELTDGGESIYKTELSEQSVFCWEEYGVNLPKADAVTITANGIVRVVELVFLDENGGIIGGKGELFDEQELVPERKTHLNSTYFDEIYHARTAYELLHGQQIYEWTHPPLGKVLISAGVAVFGMNPFGWRIVGTLFGIFMVPLIYIFAKKLFGKTAVSAFSAVLFTFDFMHLVQTRIATIDVYVTFFIMLMYLFMLMWLREGFYTKKSLVWLGLSGVSFGLGVASKWTGVYAGAGLAVIFFSELYRRYRENNAEFVEHIKQLILFCVGAFVAVPALIYLASYIPYVRAEGGGFGAILQNQIDMLSYHGGIDATHPYSSNWYEWAVIRRPVWYYSGADGEGISAFGNPLVWWTGIPAFFYTLYLAVTKKDKTAVFLTIGYLAQLLPWAAISRITFIYHYFPSVPFVVLMTGFCADRLLGDGKTAGRTMLCYAVCAVLLFALFYPVLTGINVNPTFVDDFLRWSNEWVLVRGG